MLNSWIYWFDTGMSSMRLGIDNDKDTDVYKYVALKAIELKIAKARIDLTSEYDALVAGNECITM